MLGLSRRRVAVIAWLPLAGVASGLVSSQAQETPRSSLAGEKAAQAAKNKNLAREYNLRLGSVTFQAEPSLSLEFNDNVYWTEINPVSDAILRPELKLRAFYPISQLNTLSASVGIGYEYYFDNTQLNSSVPLITPGSELVSHLFVSDWHFRLREAFSYQESLSRSGYNFLTGEFYNLEGVAKFSRYRNVIGATADWDLNKVIINLGYDHENFWSGDSLYAFLDRETEHFQTSATYLFTQKFKAGLEGNAHWNRYLNHASVGYDLQDHWRYQIGPFADIGLSPHLNLRAGIGYEGVRQFRASQWNLDEDDFFAYVKLTHRINPNFSQSLKIGKENYLGWSTESQNNYYLHYQLTIKAIRNASLIPRFSVDYVETSGRIDEKYVLYQAGLEFVYYLSERWRLTTAYNFLRKDSDERYASYDQNSLNVGIAYRY